MFGRIQGFMRMVEVVEGMHSFGRSKGFMKVREVALVAGVEIVLQKLLEEESEVSFAGVRASCVICSPTWIRRALKFLCDALPEPPFVLERISSSMAFNDRTFPPSDFGEVPTCPLEKISSKFKFEAA